MYDPTTTTTTLAKRIGMSQLHTFVIFANVPHYKLEQKTCYGVVLRFLRKHRRRLAKPRAARRRTPLATALILMTGSEESDENVDDKGTAKKTKENKGGR